MSENENSLLLVFCTLCSDTLKTVLGGERQPLLRLASSFFSFFFFLMIVDLQWCVSFLYKAKWFSYMCVCVCVCVCACGWKRKVRKTAENVQKTKIMASTPITSWQIDGDKVETVTDFIFLGSKITADSNCSHEIKRHFSLEGKLWQT